MISKFCASDFGVLTGLLMAIAVDPDACVRRLKELEAASAEARDLIDKANKVTAGQAVERAQHAQAMDALSAKQASEHEQRKREIANERAAVTELAREAEQKVRWAMEHEATVARRASDLQVRYSGAK
jgi:uncharacterized coiled-coil protein SlyX